jgi:putative transposase
MTSIEAVKSEVPVLQLCEALEIPRATLYRYWSRSQPSSPLASLSPLKKSFVSPRGLNESERETVLGVLHSDRFIDQSPQEIYSTLLDEGTYHCSVRTMYRILSEKGENKERRNIVRHKNYKKPELLATGPNQVWSWDITKLLGPEKWTYFYLYVIIDIFSRYVVGWMIADRESGEYAKALISEACEKQNIQENQLTIHSDRGTSMRSKPVAFLMADLGITKSLSRPHVSDDNPFSEAQFKTLKYCPQFPERFGCIEDAKNFGRAFFPWYNSEHKHSGIGYYTPEDVHYDRAKEVRKVRVATLSAAFAAHPERFVNKPPTPTDLPTEVWINPPSGPKKEGKKTDSTNLVGI